MLAADFKTSNSGHETYSVTGFCDTDDKGHPPLGVRVFEAGLQNFATSKEASMCQQRRAARSARRNHARRNARRHGLKRLLVEHEFLPRDSVEQDTVFQLDPYELRAKALDEPLEPFELGRVLFHLAQRRGFKSNRRSGKANEDRGILKEMGELREEIDARKSRTLGEYLYSLGTDESGSRQPLESGQVRLRNRHTRREMYEEEFAAIVDKQSSFHDEFKDESFVERVRKFLFFQHDFEVTKERRKKAPSRANLHRSPSVRPCSLIPSQQRCARDTWHAQQFRVYKEVNNLRISEHYSPHERELTPEEREAVLEKLLTSKEVKFDSLRKIVARCGADEYSAFNLERGGRIKLQGNSVEASLRNGIGAKVWNNLDEPTKTELRNALLDEEDSETLVKLLCEYGASEEKASKLADWSPADGYLACSRKAIERLLPLLEQGKSEHDAKQSEFPDQVAPNMFECLPALIDKSLPDELRDMTNPIVRRALVEVRKVVNAIIREHGRPRRIVVELAREMKDGPKGRAEHSKRNALQRLRREEAQDAVQDLHGNPRSRSDVNRYLLWKDQGGKCLYTGNAIPQSELFSGEWEVDHIIPRWRSLDDSYMNRVLVHRSANADKGNKTPAEWLGFDSAEHRELLQRARAEFSKKNLGPKLARLGKEKVEVDGFASRQLNDTRYISKAVCRYLELLYPSDLRTGEKAVQSARGGLTAELRRRWGLNRVLSPLLNQDNKPLVSETEDSSSAAKSRADHRHHAIDAVVVASASRALLKRYQDYWEKMQEGGAMAIEMPLPWPRLREDVVQQSERIHVSHRAVRRVRGALHEETMYGISQGGQGNVAEFVTRKPLASLTPAMINKIRDRQVKRYVLDRLSERGWVEGKKMPKNWDEPELRTDAGVPIRRVRIGSNKNSPAQIRNGAVVLGSNHHLALLRGEDGAIRVEVVPCIDAIRSARTCQGQAVNRNRDDGFELLMSLSRKESVLMECQEGSPPRLAVVQKMSGSSEPGTKIDLYLRDARDSRPASDANKRPFARLSSIGALEKFKLQKVTVDPLGRVNPAND